MIKIPGIDSYFGGKSGSGTYQTIINRIPPHDTFISLFLGNCGVTRHKRPASALNMLADKDARIVQAWRDVDLPGSFWVGERDAIELLGSDIAQFYDTADTFIYLDPPYLMETRRTQAAQYRHEMTTMDHQLFLSAVLQLKNAMVMISHYPNPMYDEMLAGWHTFDFMSKTRHGMALERLYYNYQLTDQLHDYRFIGEDFRQRERKTRIVNNMLAKINRLEPDLRNRILKALQEK